MPPMIGVGTVTRMAQILVKIPVRIITKPATWMTLLLPTYKGMKWKSDYNFHFLFVFNISIPFVVSWSLFSAKTSPNLRVTCRCQGDFCLPSSGSRLGLVSLDHSSKPGFSLLKKGEVNVQQQARALSYTIKHHASSKHWLECAIK